MIYPMRKLDLQFDLDVDPLELFNTLYLHWCNTNHHQFLFWQSIYKTSQIDVKIEDNAKKSERRDDEDANEFDSFKKCSKEIL